MLSYGDLSKGSILPQRLLTPHKIPVLDNYLLGASGSGNSGVEIQHLLFLDRCSIHSSRFRIWRRADKKDGTVVFVLVQEICTFCPTIHAGICFCFSGFKLVTDRLRVVLYGHSYMH